MKILLAFLLLLVLLLPPEPAAAAAVAAAPPQLLRHHYRSTTQPRPNPERGFRAQLANYRRGQRPKGVDPGGPFPYPDPQRLLHATSFNLSVVQVYCYLDSEVDTIDPVFMSSLEAGFARHRAAGIKQLLRFAYDACAPCDSCQAQGNYTTERVLKHIAQLKPFVRRNADVIYAMYAGFLGCWGEFHGSKLRLEGNSSAVSMIVAGVLDMLPPDRKVLMRYPFDKCCGRDQRGGVLRAGVVRGMKFAVADAAAAAANAPAARLGFDDDGFLCCGPDVDHGDGATWNSNAYGYPDNSTWHSEDGYRVGAGWDYVRAESPWVPMDGEMCHLRVTVIIVRTLD